MAASAVARFRVTITASARSSASQPSRHGPAGQRPADRAGGLRAHDQDVEVAADVEPLVGVVEHQDLGAVGQRPLGARPPGRDRRRRPPRAPSAGAPGSRRRRSRGAGCRAGGRATRSAGRSRWRSASCPTRPPSRLPTATDGSGRSRTGNPAAAVGEAARVHREAPEARDRQQRQARQPRVRAPAGPQPAHDPVGVAPAAHGSFPAISAQSLLRLAQSRREPAVAGGHLERASVPDRAPRRRASGIMNRSHESNRHARSASAWSGTITPPPRCAAATTPGFISRRGPVGPSGVNATAWPACELADGAEQRAGRAPRCSSRGRRDSRATRAKSARYWPSRASLTTMAIDLAAGGARAAAAAPRARAETRAAAAPRTAGASAPRRSVRIRQDAASTRNTGARNSRAVEGEILSSDAEQLVGQRHDPRGGAGLAEPLPHQGESLPLGDGDRVAGVEQRPERVGQRAPRPGPAASRARPPARPPG